ncbi:MAG: ribonuclease HI family protein [Acidimicrobiia bacterium]|nr:ribonuclease HI family protein [Acidimicrobiia bacterium]MYD41029.1 ribonuclease HI family protein [Acidimicrobiia bacterium]
MSPGPLGVRTSRGGRDRPGPLSPLSKDPGFLTRVDDTYFLYTDGAARGNPGPGAVGAVLYRGRPRPENLVAELSQAIGHTTSNVAEYRAVVDGLKMAADYRPAKLALRSDSQLLVRQLLGQYRVRSPLLRPLHREVVRLLERIPEVKIQHVPREENRRADQLANLALDS